MTEDVGKAGEAEAATAWMPTCACVTEDAGMTEDVGKAGEAEAESA